MTFLISLANSMEEEQPHLDLACRDLHFKLSFPEDTDVAQVEVIRKEAAILLTQCFSALKKSGSPAKKGIGIILNET